jgi:DNA-binding NtrC family response regulator
MARALEAASFSVVRAHSEAQALDALDAKPLALGLASPKVGAPALATIIARAGQRQPEVPVIVAGNTGTVQEAVDAMQVGAADYFILGGDAQPMMERVRKLLAARPPPVKAPVGGGIDFMGLVGSSPAMRELLARIEKISRYRTNILLLGESGSGKELVARALHAHGPRRQSLFVPVNCATLGHEILENELFGHEKGAFTGANERKNGLFELADGGTLFLDEIGEMVPSTQAKLLRVLERNEFRRVGGTGKVKVDLNVIASTHRHLGQAIDAGKFREDLYYRLKVVTIVVPPLRDRKEDIPALIESFIADFNRRAGTRLQRISTRAMKMLMEYDWPGNVRQLKNALESAAVLASGNTIGPEGFAELFASGPSREPAASTPPDGALQLRLGTQLVDAERQFIEATLRRFGTRAESARTLGIGLRTLYSKLSEYGQVRARRSNGKGRNRRNRRG